MYAVLKGIHIKNASNENQVRRVRVLFEIFIIKFNDTQKYKKPYNTSGLRTRTDQTGIKYL